MESQIVEYILKQGAAVVFFILGFFSSAMLTKQVNKDRFETLTASIDYLKKLLEQTEEECEKRISELRKDNELLQHRVKTLEDSRAFILQNGPRHSRLDDD